MVFLFVVQYIGVKIVISVWFLIPAVFLGMLFGIIIMLLYWASQDDLRGEKRKWWEDE